MTDQPGNRCLARFTAAVITAAAGLAVLIIWQARNPIADIGPALPGEDSQPEDRHPGAQGQAQNLEGIRVRGPGSPGQTPGCWPGFRGPNADNIVADPLVRLKQDWREEPPEILWQIELGEGHAAPAIRDGRVFLLDYDEINQADTLRCLSLDDGEEIWRRSYAMPLKRNHGLSRTIPAVSENYVVTLGPRCHVLCVRAATGDFLWGLDLQADFATREPFWYAGQCPLIEDNVAILAPAGSEILMMGVDCETGEILWRTPNPLRWNMSHASIMPMVVDGTRMYVYCAIGGIVGVAAQGESRGSVLWEVDEWAPSVVAPSPVVSDTGLIFVSAGYGAGSALIQVTRSGTGFAARLLDHFSPKEGLASEQQTPILVDRWLYAVLPKDAGGQRNQFACAPLENPRQLLATSGATTRFGLGPFLRVGGLFLILNDDGTLYLARFSPDGYTELGRAKILEGRDAWGPLALVNDRLLLRDDKTLACVKLPLEGATAE